MSNSNKGGGNNDIRRPEHTDQSGFCAAGALTGEWGVEGRAWAKPASLHCGENLTAVGVHALVVQDRYVTMIFVYGGRRAYMIP